jgi:hypothetical protein
MNAFLRRIATSNSVRWIACVAFTVAITWGAAYSSYSSMSKGRYPTLLGAAHWAMQTGSGWIFAVLAAMVLWLSLRIAARLGDDGTRHKRTRAEVKQRIFIFAVALASFVCGAVGVKLFEHIWYG